MRKVLLLGLVLSFLFTSPGWTEMPKSVSTPSAIKSVAPDSILDFKNQSRRECEYPVRAALLNRKKGYSYSVFISKNPAKSNLKIDGPYLTLHVDYSKEITPITKSEWLKKAGGNTIQVSNYPVEVVGGDSLRCAKGQYSLYVSSHYFSSKSEGLKYAKSAMSHMLSRIANVADTATAQPKQPSVPSSPAATPSTQPAKKPAQPKKTIQILPSRKKDPERIKRQEAMKKRSKALEKQFDYKYSDEYKQEQAEKETKRAKQEAKEEAHITQRQQTEGMFASMLAGESQLIPEEEKKTVICGGVLFTYYPSHLKKLAKSSETYEVGKWKYKTFVGDESYKWPISYDGKYYVPVAYLSGERVTGYVWIDQVGNVVSSAKANRALFTYMYVFGFGGESVMKKEIKAYEEAAKRNDEEINDYSNYKDAAKILKVASSAMGAYLSGGLGVGLAAADVGIFLTKMDMLEDSGATSPDLSSYEDLSDTAQTLDSLKDLSDAVTAAKNMQRLQTQVQTLKTMQEVKNNKVAMEAARVKMLDAVKSLGWAIFDKAESTGEIAEQAAVIAIKFKGLKLLNTVIAKTYKEALNGIDNDKEAKNIFLLHKMRAKAYKLKGDLAQLLLTSYRQRKTRLSGYIGRFTLYVQGKSVDEDKAEQTIINLQMSVEKELDYYFDMKVNTDVSTGLAVQRAGF